MRHPCSIPAAAIVEKLKLKEKQKEKEDADQKGQKRSAEGSAASSSWSRDTKQRTYADCMVTHDKAALDMLVSKFFFAVQASMTCWCHLSGMCLLPTLRERLQNEHFKTFFRLRCDDSTMKSELC